MIALVQATFPDRETAARIGRALVEERLAACVNVLGECRSIYRWRGVVEGADEVVAQFKTTPDLAGRLGGRLVELHPYDLPAVEWWKVAAAPAVMEWITAELDSPVA